VTVRDDRQESATASVTITVIQPAPAGADLAVSVTDTLDPALFSRPLTYTITATNRRWSSDPDDTLDPSGSDAARVPRRRHPLLGSSTVAATLSGGLASRLVETAGASP
jgi:hypothetical protein